MSVGAIITLLAPVIIKLVEWLLDRSKLTKAQAKAIVDLIKQSQKFPVPSVMMKEMLENAEDDIMKQERGDK